MSCQDIFVVGVQYKVTVHCCRIGVFVAMLRNKQAKKKAFAVMTYYLLIPHENCKLFV